MYQLALPSMFTHTPFRCLEAQDQALKTLQVPKGLLKPFTKRNPSSNIVKKLKKIWEDFLQNWITDNNSPYTLSSVGCYFSDQSTFDTENFIYLAQKTPKNLSAYFSLQFSSTSTYANLYFVPEGILTEEMAYSERKRKISFYKYISWLGSKFAMKKICQVQMDSCRSFLSYGSGLLMHFGRYSVSFCKMNQLTSKIEIDIRCDDILEFIGNNILVVVGINRYREDSSPDDYLFYGVNLDMIKRKAEIKDSFINKKKFLKLVEVERRSDSSIKFIIFFEEKGCIEMHLIAFKEKFDILHQFKNKFSPSLKIQCTFCRIFEEKGEEIILVKLGGFEPYWVITINKNKIQADVLKLDENFLILKLLGMKANKYAKLFFIKEKNKLMEAFEEIN